mgnify:CR=1 FL=1
MTNLADRLFAGRTAEGELEALLERHGVPFEELGWDGYDFSLEVRDAPPDYRMPRDVQDVLFKVGFLKVYVNHIDKWETHYDVNGSAKGWRVSYPHKRRVDTKGIWVEEVVPTWPKEWFDTGYAIVKPADPLSSPAT